MRRVHPGPALCAAAFVALAVPAAAADPAPPAASEPGTAPASARDAAAAWPLPAGATLEVPAGAGIYARKKAPPSRALPGEERFARPGEVVDGLAALDEIIDEVAADVAHLGAARLSPILLDRLRVSGGLDPGLAAIVEARLAAALHRAADVALVRCVECDATRAEVVDAAWVVSRGITRQEQLQAVGRRAGARTLLRASLSAGPDSLALDLELVRTDDGVIAWAESYRYGGDNAMLYRSADRAQAREERLRELQARLDEKPVWGFAAQLGYVTVPASRGGDVAGPFGLFRVDERFGTDREHRVSIGAGGLQSSAQGVSGGVVELGLWTRVSSANVWAQQVHLGGTVGFFLGGSVGNSPWFAGHVEWRVATRLGVHASLGYLAKFRYMDKPDRPLIGGFTPEAGVSFLW